MKNEHWLRFVVKQLQSVGCNKFTVFINDDETAVIMRGHGETYYDRVLHRIHKQKNDTVHSCRDRLIRWCGQYDHWLKWVLMTQDRENVGNNQR